MAKPRTRKAKPTGTPGRRRGIKARTTSLPAGELALDLTALPDSLATLAGEVKTDGGAVLAAYREPLGAHALLLVALPIELIAPTPFQRDLSDTHVRRLVHAMDKTKRYLDPVIVVREAGEDGTRYWTPNGYHRLTAMKELAGKSIVALLVPERAVAYQILALNIEKAHNLREKAIGVFRMYRDLAASVDSTEETLALEFEEPALATLGFAYNQRPRLAGGAYHPILRKTDHWIAGSLSKGMAGRERRAGMLLELDEAVTNVVAALKERGMTSPYLRTFVVARINPLRFIKGDPPPVEEFLPSLTKRARGMNVDKIRTEDVARTGGAAPEPE